MENHQNLRITMKTHCTIALLISALIMNSALINAQDTADTIITADADSFKIYLRQNEGGNFAPESLESYDPDDPNLIILGDFFELPFIVGTRNTDFYYYSTKNTNLFTDKYQGMTTRDVYYKFQLTTPMNVVITHEGSELYDTYVSLLDSAGNMIESNDNYSGDGHCSNTLHSFIQRQLSPGIYYVVSEGNNANGTIKTNIYGYASEYGYTIVPAAYSTEPGTTVEAVGGVFNVSPMGGATYSIPIDVPLGVGGLQPRLSIIYNSQSGNGLCGYGASLSGLSSITRAPKDIHHDNNANGLEYLADDALYLDGVRLILDENSIAGQEGAVYYPESDPFTRVIAHGTCTSTANNTWYEVQSRDGMVYRYGYNPDLNTDTHSRLSYTDDYGAQKIHSWYLSYVSQPTGNYMTYEYDIINLCVYPYRIRYGNNSYQSNSLTNTIEFTYNEDRTDSIPVIFDGKRGSMKRRLHSITGMTGSSVYRTYTLNYNTTGDGVACKFSRLTSVTEKNAQNQTLPPTTVYWSYLPPISYTASALTVNQPTNINPFVSFPFANQSYMAGDFNGDGRSDIAGIALVGEPNNNGGEDYYTYIYMYHSTLSQSGTSQYISGTNFILPPSVESGRIKSNVNALSVIDVDGDGINELIIPYYVQSGSTAALGLYVLGQNFSVGDGGGATSLYNTGKPLFTSGDIDNDGRTDVVFMEKTKRNGSYPLYLWKYNINYISGSNELEHSLFDMDTETSLSLSSAPQYVYISDMNGNGLNDLIVICNSGYSIYWNQGNGISANTYSDANKSTGTSLKDVHSLTPGDYNGDGLMDFLSNTKGSNNWYFILNKGNGTFNETLALNMSVISDQSFTDQDNDKLSVNVVDMDSDGKSDVIITKGVYKRKSNFWGQEWGEFDYVITKWLNSTGATLVEKHSATSEQSSDMYSSKYITGDFDGDGRMELVNYGYDCVNGTNSNSNPVWRIYKNSNLTVQSGKVTSITGDYGATIGITYSTLTDPSVYTKGGNDPYPAPRYTIPLNVVRLTTQNNGAAGSLTTLYTYEGLKAHLRGRGLLGFSKMAANCTTTGLISESGVTQWNTVFYIPKVTYSKTTVGSSYAQNTTTLTIADKGQKRYFAYPSQTVARDMDGNTVTTVSAYDTTYGYPLSETTTYGTGMYRTITYSNYALAGGAYHPQTITSAQKHQDDASPFSITASYTYDNTTGLITDKVDNYGTSKPLTTQYTYDVWGNLTNQVSTGSGITAACTTYYSYDETRRFPARVYTNPASSVQKYTYDLWGNVLTEQDSINSSVSNTVTHSYNGWGQLVSTVRPDGTATTYTRGWNNSAFKRYYLLAQGTATPWVKTWYDNQGREVKTESIGPDNVSLTSTTTYNSKGLATSRTETSGDLSLTHTYTYDTRGRVLTETAPGNSYTAYQYGNRTVAVSENSRTTTTTYDAWGNVKTVTAPVSGITNTYASNGGIRTTASGGATWTFQYDDRGNRSSMTDPDAGTTTYTYDALGRETSRTDARGVVFVTKYDYLGRVTQQKADDATINYTYGSSGTDQMRLISESNGTWSKNYTYDALGRVTGETMSKGTAFTRSRSYTYGSNGLIASRTLPGGMVYSYSYDPYGNLNGIDMGPGIVGWTSAGYTGRRTTAKTVLNGDTDHPFIRTIALDGYGLPDSIITLQRWGQSYCSYQAEDYGFSPQTGNLMYRSGIVGGGYPQQYTYDTADRLTLVQEDNQTIMTMAYAQNGNILSKTGMGSYTYGSSSRPHAVTEVDNTDGSITLQVQDVGFNYWNKMSSVWATDENNFYSYSVDYGPDLRRVSSEMHRTYQKLYEKFYWDDYEEKVEGSDTLRYYYLNGANGLEALHIVKTSPNAQPVSQTTKVVTDHLGSITALIDESDYAYIARYDAWGNRENVMPYWFDLTFDRGYTGHEHLEMLGLINMNGRMYDPLLGRFLSPDPYIQAPTDPQNFNRYSYCLNNPLKYTDPDGESITAIVAMSLLACGMTNLFIQANNNKIDTFGDALNALVGGAAAGLSEASSWALAFAGIASGTPLGVLLGHGILLSKRINFDATLVNSIIHPINTTQMMLGRYYTDENGNAWDQAKQGLSRFMWEGPQTWAGYNWSQIRSIGDRVDEVDYLGGATFCINEDGTYGSVSLGNYINADIRGSYLGSITKHPVLMHEYGHTFDSRKYGPSYLFAIGIPSAKSADKSNKDNGYNHSWYRTELRANRAAKEYFGIYYGVDWSRYETDMKQNYYPVVVPSQIMIDNYIEYLKNLDY
ncbi:MAG: VCBS repeat-containing protein [Bacteroidaceae bacterium]|nr:VCBS repeat-containing protein [Bacteroidaceae bacterium]